MNTPTEACPMVVAGEALIDLIQQPNGMLSPQLGGSPWNLARALGRLGRAVHYRNPLSVDGYGQQLAQSLDDSHVRRTGGQSAQPTSLALVKVDAHGHPDYAFYRAEVADRDLPPLDILADWPAGASLFHVGSLSLIPPDGHQWLALLDALLAKGVTTSVDINMRPMVAPDKTAYAELALRVLQRACIAKVSDEDLRAMNRTGDPLTEATQLLNNTTLVVLLTLGEAGAWCITRQGQWFQAPPQVTVVDTVGAGDCFYAGFLARLDELGVLAVAQRGAPPGDVLVDALAFGARTTAHNLQRAGCQPPWRHEV
jgi:fructokinase